MFSFPRFLVFLFLLIKFLSAEEFECVVSDSDRLQCTISGVFENQLNSSYSFTVEDPSQILRLIVKASRISTWTSQFCNYFPNLEKITASRIGVAKIAPSSLHNCTKLKILDFSFNELKEVPNNALEKLVSLDTLYLYNNNLNYFAADTLKGLSELKKLALISNEIFEIDEEMISSNCPKLQDFWFNDNNLRCDRISKIKANLRRKNVNPFSYVSELRKRPETTRKVDDFLCLADSQWIESIRLSVASSSVDAEGLVANFTRFQTEMEGVGKKVYQIEDKVNIVEQEARAKIEENLHQIEQTQERIINLSARVSDASVLGSKLITSLNATQEMLEDFRAEVELNMTLVEEVFEARLHDIEEAHNSSKSEAIAELRLREGSGGEMSWVLLLGLFGINLLVIGGAFLALKVLVKNQVIGYFQRESKEDSFL